MNLEEMYMTLYGASRAEGAKYDVVRKWFTECGIIDGRLINNDLFEHSYVRLSPNKEGLSMTQFIQLLGILARMSRQTVAEFIVKFETVNRLIIEEIQGHIVNSQHSVASSDNVSPIVNKTDEAYEKLRKEGKNSVDDIIKWMKESKVIEQTKESEANARNLFTDVQDTTNVELAKFMEAVGKLAAQQKKSVEELTRMLSEETPKFLQAARAGIDAFKDTFKK